MISPEQEAPSTVESLVTRHDVGLDVRSRQGPANGVELRTDLDLPKRLDRVAVDSLETASIGRKQGRDQALKRQGERCA